MNGEGLLSLGFLYLSCITHAQLSKAANRIDAIDLVNDISGYGEILFSAGVLLRELAF